MIMNRILKIHWGVSTASAYCGSHIMRFHRKSMYYLVPKYCKDRKLSLKIFIVYSSTTGAKEYNILANKDAMIDLFYVY